MSHDPRELGMHRWTRLNPILRNDFKEAKHIRCVFGSGIVFNSSNKYCFMGMKFRGKTSVKYYVDDDPQLLIFPRNWLK